MGNCDKEKLKKLDIDGTIQEMAENCQKLDIQILDLAPVHLDELENLLLIHKDPFDRILIAQARVEGMTLITKDTVMPKYEVPVLW